MFRYVFNLVLIVGLYCQNEQGNSSNYNTNNQQQHGNENNANRSEYETATTKQLDNTKDPLNPISIYVYVGIGVGILVLFAIQTCCFIWYFKRAKLQRVNDIAGNSNENTSNETARYSKRPMKNAIKTVESDPNVYECLLEVPKAPTPPPVNSLPKRSRTVKKSGPSPIKSSGSPNSIRSQKSTQSTNSTKSNVKDPNSPNSIRHREKMPLPHEIPKPDIPPIKIPSTRHRPKLPSPTETIPMVTTLPSKINKSKISVNKSNTFNSSQDTIVNTELLEKLKKRAEINASLDESSTLTSHSNSLGSRKPVETKPRLQGRQQQREPRAQLQMPTRQVQYTNGWEYRDSSSDNEWTMEQLEPYNIYNI